jgi:hypothetical protein
MVAFTSDAMQNKKPSQKMRGDFCPAQLRHLQRFFEVEQVPQVMGSCRLGVRSHQFDEGKEVLNKFEGPLVMRMRPRRR